MTLTPLLSIFVLLITGAAITLFILFLADRNGQFRNLERGAHVIFDADEPAGEPQDQTLRPELERKAESIAPVFDQNRGKPFET